MGDVILIRHGETEWSRSRQHTSFTDLPLTAHGEEQSRAVAPLLAGRRIALALTSPMRRATRTAELIGLGTAEVDPDLREWDYGGYEGVTTAEIHRDRPGWDLWSDGVIEGPPDHPGEGPADVATRADRALGRLDPLLREPDAGDVALVGHAHILRVLTARWLDMPAAGGRLFRLDTGTVSVLGTEHGRRVISRWNCSVTPPSR